MQLNEGILANNWQIERAEALDWRAAGSRSPHWNCFLESLVITLQCRSHSSPKLREIDESGMGSDSLVVGDIATRWARRLNVWSK